MKALKKMMIAVVSLFGFTVAVYWFNLDTKFVKLIEKPMMKHYDEMARDHRL